MAFWNAPLDDPDHARHAVAAAQDMRAQLVELNAMRAEAARSGGAPAAAHRHRHQYRRMLRRQFRLAPAFRLFAARRPGEPRLAARRPDQALRRRPDPRRGHRGASSATPDLIELDLVAVKGKTRRCASSPCRRIRSRRSSSWPATPRCWPPIGAATGPSALGLLDDETLAGEDDMAPVYELFRERIDQLQIEPPPDDWDGVFVAAEK